MIGINIGCGQHPTTGWINFDNSPSVRLARMPRLARVLRLLGALSPENMRFIEFARRHQIRWADATRRIPVPDRSVDAIYSSHMISYLDQPRITRFLAEARRVLKPGGVIRLADHDFDAIIVRYLQHHDAARFGEGTFYAFGDLRRSRRAILREALYGCRFGCQCFSEVSLCRLLLQAGFQEPRRMALRETRIAEAGNPSETEDREDVLIVEAANV